MADSMDVEAPAAAAANSMSSAAPSLPWVEKYRPTELGDLVSHTEIISTLQKLMTQAHKHPLLPVVSRPVLTGCL